MTLIWREQYDWFGWTRNAGCINTPASWELVHPDDPWVHYGVVVRTVGRSPYQATCNCAGLPQPTKTFRSLKQAKAWVQAMAILNQ